MDQTPLLLVEVYIYRHQHSLLLVEKMVKLQPWQAALVPRIHPMY